MSRDRLLAMASAAALLAPADAQSPAAPPKPAPKASVPRSATATPLQDTATQKSPCRKTGLQVTVDSPRDHTGMSYCRSSCTSVAGPSSMMPTQPAVLAETATPPPQAA